MTTPKPLIYIAGPLTHPCPMTNTRAACLAAHEVRLAGYATIVPHLSVLENIIFPNDYEVWMDNDLAVLERCDAVLRLPGKSAGADREVARAWQLGIPVYDSIEAMVLGGVGRLGRHYQ